MEKAERSRRLAIGMNIKLEQNYLYAMEHEIDVVVDREFILSRDHRT
jgi:hypothetical protein